jgi:membrane associated rhomboid family serine protease
VVDARLTDVISVFERRLPPVIAGLIGLVLVSSLAAALDPTLYERLALVPDRVWHGELWRLVTWPFIATGPLSLIFAVLELYWFGGGLLREWRPARLLRFVVAIVLISGVGTCLLALVLPPAWWMPYLGTTALGTAILIAYGLQFPRAHIRLWLIAVISGEALAYFLLALTALVAIFYGPAVVLPSLIASLATWLYMTGAPTRWYRSFQRRRARGKLSIIPGDRHGGPYAPN